MAGQAPAPAAAPAPPAEKTELEKRFPDAVKRDTRAGYEGHIIESAKLRDVAQSIRDEMGYDYLSSVTPVDYYSDAPNANNFIEVAYHLYKSTGGGALVYK
ncbi:MAG: NADH-quinone oxidoreductase subunit C, partial [Anaerolineales bacterium]